MSTNQNLEEVKLFYVRNQNLGDIDRIMRTLYNVSAKEIHSMIFDDNSFPKSTYEYSGWIGANPDSDEVFRDIFKRSESRIQLIHSTTGSGKTSVFKRLGNPALGKDAINIVAFLPNILTVNATIGDDDPLRAFREGNSISGDEFGRQGFLASTYAQASVSNLSKHKVLDALEHKYVVLDEIQYLVRNGTSIAKDAMAFVQELLSGRIRCKGIVVCTATMSTFMNGMRTLRKNLDRDAVMDFELHTFNDTSRTTPRFNYDFKYVENMVDETNTVINLGTNNPDDNFLMISSHDKIHNLETIREINKHLKKGDYWVSINADTKKDLKEDANDDEIRAKAILDLLTNESQLPKELRGIIMTDIATAGLSIPHWEVDHTIISSDDFDFLAQGSARCRKFLNGENSKATNLLHIRREIPDDGGATDITGITEEAKDQKKLVDEAVVKGSDFDKTIEDERFLDVDRNDEGLIVSSKYFLGEWLKRFKDIVARKQNILALPNKKGIDHVLQTVFFDNEVVLERGLFQGLLGQEVDFEEVKEIIKEKKQDRKDLKELKKREGIQWVTDNVAWLMSPEYNYKEVPEEHSGYAKKFVRMTHVYDMDVFTIERAIHECSVSNIEARIKLRVKYLSMKTSGMITKYNDEQSLSSEKFLRKIHRMISKQTKASIYKRDTFKKESYLKAKSGEWKNLAYELIGNWYVADKDDLDRMYIPASDPVRKSRKDVIVIKGMVDMDNLFKAEFLQSEEGKKIKRDVLNITSDEDDLF